MIALQLDTVLRPEIIWVFIPLAALAIPIVAIICNPIMSYMRSKEREAARKTYETLAREKLDVIKTAVAMGMSHNEIAELDARLEKLIGVDQLQGLLQREQPQAPPPSAELMDSDLSDEVERLKDAQRKERLRG